MKDAINLAIEGGWKDNPGGMWTSRGLQDVLGCVGDFFYEYKIN